MAKTGRKSKYDGVKKKRGQVTTQYYNPLITSIEREAAKYGLDGSTYIAYRDNGYLEKYIRRKFHEDTERNANNTIVEVSCLGSNKGTRIGSPSGFDKLTEYK